MNNICVIGVVRAYLSFRVYIPRNRGSHTGYWLSRAAIIIWEFADIAISTCCGGFSLYAQTCVLWIEMLCPHFVILIWRKNACFDETNYFSFDNNDIYKYNMLRCHSALKTFSIVKLEYKSRGKRSSGRKRFDLR